MKSKIIEIARPLTGSRFRKIAVLAVGLVLPFASSYGYGVKYSNNFSADAAGWDAPGSRGTWGVSNPLATYDHAASGQRDLSLYGPTTWGTNYTLRLSLQAASLSSTQKIGAVYNYVDDDNYYEVLISDTTAEVDEIVHGRPTTVATAGYAGGGSNVWIEVEIERTAPSTSPTDENSMTTVRVNGTRVLAPTVQERLDNGRIGLVAIGTASKYDNVSVTPYPVIVYSEDFSKGRGEIESDWRPVSGEPHWAFSGGTYNYSDSDRDGDKDVERAQQMSVHTDGRWGTDYTYGASVWNEESDASNRNGIIYNYVDSGNWCEVLLDPTGTAQLYRETDGTLVSLGTAPYVGAGTHVWTNITVVRSGTDTTVNINDRRAFEVQQTLAPGEVGLVADNDDAKFDDVFIADGPYPYKQTFPKLAAIFIGGGRQFGTPSYQQVVAKYDLVLLGMYQGFTRNGLTPAQMVSQIKAYNPLVLLGNYSDVCDQYVDPANGNGDAITQLNAGVGPQGNGGTWTPNDWWARNNAGEQITQFGTNTGLTNVTFFTTPDAATGWRYPQWYANWTDSAFFFNSAGFDFAYSDAFSSTAPEFTSSFGTGDNMPDWNRDGVDDTWNDPTVSTWYRQGLATWAQKITQLEPGIFTMGNIGAGINNHPEAFPEYQRLVTGAIFEGATGQTWSEETWSGWNNLMDAYRSLMDNSNNPHLVMFGAQGTSTGLSVAPSIESNYNGGANYAFMRYSLASALMEDGYFSYANDLYFVSQALWFDEFDLVLGRSVDAPVRTPTWTTGPAAGAYMRRFQNGAAIVNPRWNPDLSQRSPVAIDLTGQGYRKFLGTQDPVTNDGTSVTTLTIAAGDGILLLKTQ